MNKARHGDSALLQEALGVEWREWLSLYNGRSERVSLGEDIGIELNDKEEALRRAGGTHECQALKLSILGKSKVEEKLVGEG